MAVLVGIDEAGFGPILGPLVVSSSTFSLPHHLIEADLWQILRKSVGGRRKRLAGRLLIADSKKAHNRREGVKHLQRTVLAVLRNLGENPSSLTELLSVVCPDSLGRIEGYPWYKGLGNYSVLADEADLAIASSVLAEELRSKGMKLLELKSDCLDVGYYNKMVGSVKNKASVLFTATSRLIKRAFDNFGGDDLQIVVDRQGGRVRYRKVLRLSFADMELKILKETVSHSSYELRAGDRRMRLHFVVGADARFLPVALASMVSKFLRELLVYNINRYFASFGAELKPTAGYWKDGLRFIADLKKQLPHIEYDRDQLIRCR